MRTQLTTTKSKPAFRRTSVSSQRLPLQEAGFLFLMRGNSMEGTCEFCSHTFNVSPYYIRRGQRYCSQLCSSLARRVNPQPYLEVSCFQCGKGTIKQAGKVKRNAHQFCSWRCYSSWRNGKFTGESSPCWQGGRIPYGSGWTEAVRQEVRRRDNFTCQVCGKSTAEYGRKLDVHHIVTCRNGGSHSPDNLLTVCQTCHAKLDRLGKHKRAALGSKLAEIR